MYGAHNWFDRVRHEFRFSPEEVKGLVLAIIVLSFAIGFNDNTETFDMAHWLLNFLNCILLVTLSLLFRETAHRVFSIRSGHKVEFKVWPVGLGLALAASVLSYGKVPLLVYGGFLMSYVPRQRLGYFRYGLSFQNMATVALWGNLASLLLALFFRIAYSFIPNPLINLAIMVNIMLACLNMLPIPPLTGSIIFFTSRTYYVFSLALIVGASLMIFYLSNIFLIIAGSLLAAGLIALIYHIFVELR
jgi:Zn-dependent protease